MGKLNIGRSRRLSGIVSAAATVAVAGIVSMAPKSALADQACRQVRIIIENRTPETIRIYKLEYQDIEDGRTRTENVPNAAVPSNLAFEMSKNLGSVGNERIGQVRVQFRSGIGTVRAWSEWKRSGINRCKRGDILRHAISR